MNDKGTAARDLVLVAVVSVAMFAAELALQDRLPWGAEARGVSAVLAGAIAAVCCTLLGGRSLKSLGFRAPGNLRTAPLWAFAMLVTFIIAQNVAIGVIAPLVDAPQPDMSRYDFIRGNLPAAIGMGILLPLLAAAPEEIIYRGFLIERLEVLLGKIRGADKIAVLIQAVIFGSIHFQWGLGGILMSTIMGLVWGFGFLLCGRNLWIVIIAHSMAHLALVAQIYFTPAG